MGNILIADINTLFNVTTSGSNTENLKIIFEGLRNNSDRWFLSETLDDVDSLKDLKEEVFK